MRSRPGSFVLSFLLPKGFDLPSMDGRTYLGMDCRVRCVPPLVKIYGPSREGVFECATLELRAALHDRSIVPVAIAAVLVSPPPVSGSDSWSIIVGADVAFSPTSLDPHFPRASVA